MFGKITDYVINPTARRDRQASPSPEFRNCVVFPPKIPQVGEFFLLHLHSHGTAHIGPIGVPCSCRLFFLGKDYDGKFFYEAAPQRFRFPDLLPQRSANEDVAAPPTMVYRAVPVVALLLHPPFFVHELYRLWKRVCSCVYARESGKPFPWGA